MAGLLSLLGIPGAKRGPSARGVVIRSQAVRAALGSALLLDVDHRDMDDGEYLALPEDEWRRMTDRWWDSGIMARGRGEFPDCDDFAKIAMGAILRGAYKEGLRTAPAFGRINLRAGGGPNHQMNFAVAPELRVLLFEPQNGYWYGDLSNFSNATRAWL